MQLQNFVTHGTGVKVVKYKNIEDNAEGDVKCKDKYMKYKRLWPPIINIMQTEDSEG